MDNPCIEQVLRMKGRIYMKLAERAKLLKSNGAEDENRTRTRFPPLPPQDSVSTNSTTSARVICN